MEFSTEDDVLLESHGCDEHEAACEQHDDPASWDGVVMGLWRNDQRRREEEIARHKAVAAEARPRVEEAEEGYVASFVEMLRATGSTEEQISAYREERSRKNAAEDALLDMWDRAVEAGDMPAELRDAAHASLDAYTHELHDRSAAGQPILQPHESPTWRKHLRELCRRWPREMFGHRRADALARAARTAERDVDAGVAAECGREAAADAVDDAHTCWFTSAPPPRHCLPTSFCRSATSGAARMRVEHVCEVWQ